METKICKCCGKELPTTEFIKRHFGESRTCKACNAKHIAESKKTKKEEVNARELRLHDFTPRELMNELARRGYEGKLTFVEVHEIDITNF